MKNQIDALLSKYPENIANLTSEVCKFVAAHCDGADSKVQMGWKVVVYELEKGFCAVAPHQQWVNLQFYEGTNLPDPTNLLEGTGKAMRHVKIRRSDDLDKDLRALVLAAAEIAR